MVRKELLKIKLKKKLNDTMLGRTIILILILAIVFLAIYLGAVALAMYNLTSVLETL